MLADILLSIAGMVFTGSVVPQIIKVHRQKSAKQLSWLFLSLTSFSIILFIVGKILVHCHIAALFDSFGLAGYIILMGQKFYYLNCSSCNVITRTVLDFLE